MSRLVGLLFDLDVFDVDDSDDQLTIDDNQGTPALDTARARNRLFSLRLIHCRR